MSTRLSDRRPASIGAAGLALLILLLARTSVVAQQVTLRDLTVPTDRLPAQCSVKAIEKAQGEIVTTSTGSQTVRVIPPTQSMQPGGMDPVTANPWTGTERRILAELRQRVDGNTGVRMPDGPPLTNRESSAMLLRFADGVEEGYAATYAQSGGKDLGVWAVRLAAPADKGLDLPNRYNIGSIRVVVFGDAGVCSTAIETHLKSLGK